MKMANRNNQNYKCICLACDLRDDEIIDICELGGIKVSRDRIKRWRRSPDAGPGRYSAMADEEFDAFCSGLTDWARENLKENPRQGGEGRGHP